MARMTDPYPPTSPDQHDTAAYVRPLPGQPGAAAGYGPGQSLGWSAQAGDPEAERWAARYRRQRTISTVLGVGMALALVAVLGLGVTTWQLTRSNQLLDSASELADALGGGPGGLLQEDSDGLPALPGDEEDGADSLLDGLLPDGPSAEDGAAGDLSDVPLPEALSGLGSVLGITDVGELLDRAVANGLMSEEDAEQLRRVLTAGSALGGLAAQDS